MGQTAQSRLAGIFVLLSCVFLAFTAGSLSFIFLRERLMPIRKEAIQSNTTNANETKWSRFFSYPPDGKLVKTITIGYTFYGQLVKKTDKEDGTSLWQLDNLEKGEPLVFQVTDQTAVLILGDGGRVELSHKDVQVGASMTISGFFYPDKNKLEIAGVYVTR